MDRKLNDSAGRHAKAPDLGGPISFMNPTIRYRAVTRKESAPSENRDAPQAEGSPSASEAHQNGPCYVWRSRDNRKGRHAVAVPPKYFEDGKATGPRATNTAKEIVRGVGKLFVRYPVWDVSYDVAAIFVWGSIIWVINGFFVWYPLQDPASEFPNESPTGGGVTAFIGATVFELGSILLMLEAVNENRADCFGWAVDESIEGGLLRLRTSEETCLHSHHEKGTWLRAGKRKGMDPDGEKLDEDARGWSWWPSRHELRTHYAREIGFWACSWQMFGATVFWISGFTGLPPILDSLSLPAENGVYWLPQVIGGSGFIISGILFMVETQPKWYMPAPKILGWHVGFWNLLGGIGFTMCGGFGFALSVASFEYASALCTFVGGWAFLIGSVLQWYESLDKYPLSTE